jgi:predicted NUDIX family phosphoesterase
MSVANEEQVLCFPATLLTKLGEFSGFNANANHYVRPILASENLCFVPRGEAELNPDWKQIIPYIVIQWKDTPEFFTYRRGDKGGEARLKTRRSLGIGGHINQEDNHGNGPDTFQAGSLRELKEELDFKTFSSKEQIVGVLYDPSTEVGKVHFGVVKLIRVFESDRENIKVVDDALIESRWDLLTDLKELRSDFEVWSQFVIDYLDRKSLKRANPNEVRFVSSIED